MSAGLWCAVLVPGALFSPWASSSPGLSLPPFPPPARFVLRPPGTGPWAGVHSSGLDTWTQVQSVTSGDSVTRLQPPTSPEGLTRVVIR